MRRAVVGVDFSGAANAGRHMWVALGYRQQAGVRIVMCCRGDELPGSGLSRDDCLGGLRRFIAAQTAAVVGLDFPLGLPLALLGDQPWEKFVCTFRQRYRSPEQFRAWCLAGAGGRELKRLTDRLARTPFSPYNLRLYRQTFYGIGWVLEPLIRAKQARVLPMQAPDPALPWLIEICPASTLKAEGLRGPYKGRSSQHQAARVALVRALEARGVEFAEAQVRQRAVADPGGDALDSVLGAWAAVRAGVLRVRRHLLDCPRMPRRTKTTTPGQRQRAAWASGGPEAELQSLELAAAVLREGWVFV